MLPTLLKYSPHSTQNKHNSSKLLALHFTLTLLNPLWV